MDLWRNFDQTFYVFYELLPFNRFSRIVSFTYVKPMTFMFRGFTFSRYYHSFYTRISTFSWEGILWYFLTCFGMDLGGFGGPGTPKSRPRAWEWRSWQGEEARVVTRRKSEKKRVDGASPGPGGGGSPGLKGGTWGVSNALSQRRTKS